MCGPLLMGTYVIPLENVSNIPLLLWDSEISICHVLELETVMAKR